MRLTTSLANLFVLLSVVTGVPQEHGLGTGAHINLPSSTCDVVFVGAPASGPAQSRASEDSDRIEVAAVWKSVQSDIAILPNGLVLPSLGSTATCGRRRAPFRSSAASSSCIVRGPPVAL